MLGTLVLVTSVCAAADERVSPGFETEDVYASKVRFDDLDLDRRAGAETLYQRLKSAAWRVCDLQPTRYRERVHERQGCYADSLRRAVEAVGRPRTLPGGWIERGRARD